MTTTILIDLNALPEDLEAHAVQIIDRYGEIEAAFIARVMGELADKLTAFTKDAVTAQAEEQGGLELGAWKMTPVAGRKIYDYSQSQQWLAIKEEKEAVAAEMKELEKRLQKELPFEKSAPTYQFKCAVKGGGKIGGKGMTPADDSSPIEF